MSIVGLPLILFQVEDEEEDMADNYLEFIRYNATVFLTTDKGRDRIGYNRDDTVLQLVYNAAKIAQNGVASIHLADDVTDYQNNTSETVYTILTVLLEDAGSASYKIYSAPTTDSIAGATEVFDSNSLVSVGTWATNQSALTSYQVPIQPNHFIVVENTSPAVVRIAVTPVGIDTPFGIVVEPSP